MSSRSPTGLNAFGEGPEVRAIRIVDGAQWLSDNWLYQYLLMERQEQDQFLDWLNRAFGSETSLVDA